MAGQGGPASQIECGLRWLGNRGRCSPKRTHPRMGPMRTEASKQRGLAPRRRSPSVIMAHLKHLRAKWLAQAGLAAPAPVPAAPAAASAASAPVPKPEQRLQQTAQPPQAAAEQHRGAQANGGTLLPKKRLLEAAGAAGTGPGPGQQERCAPAATALQRRSTRRVQALGRLALHLLLLPLHPCS